MTDGADAPFEAGFADFLDAWNAGLDQTTPRHHRRIAQWLEERWEARDPRLLLMAFRGAGKSTLLGLFSAWILAREPDKRLMVLAADLTLAKKMVRNVKRIIELSPDLKARLKPAERDQWATEQFTVKRRLELRDPSMLARGIDGNITGSRADVVICDDVEVPRTCNTAPKRGDLRAKLAEIDYVLVPGGLQLYVGTPHSYYTIYAEEPRPELGETHPFLEGFSRLMLPVYDGNGTLAWPERFTDAEIERTRRRTGANKFTSQMLLQPVNIASGRLDPERLRPYDGELEHREAVGRALLTLDGRPLVASACWWDPAFRRPDVDGATGDGSVVAAAFADKDGNIHLHRMLYLSVDPADPEDEATQQCRAVVAFLRDLHLPAIAVETNGIGKFLPGRLRTLLKEAKLGVAVLEKTSRGAKAERIVAAFEARLAGGRLHAHRSVWDTPFIREMREWRDDGRYKGPDDGLDAAAGALSLLPDLHPEIPGALRRPDWRLGPVVAPAEWEV